MIFSSVEGQGSIFGFRLPIEPLQASTESDDLKDHDNNK